MQKKLTMTLDEQVYEGLYTICPEEGNYNVPRNLDSELG